MHASVALRLSGAETRRAHGTLLFCVLSVAMGVLSITAIRSLSDSLKASLAGQARKILGGDLVLSSQRPLDSAQALALIADLESRGARSARSVRFYSMLKRVAERPGKATQLVRLRAVGDGFPFYGHIETTPPNGLARLGEAPGVLLDPAVARALQLAPGDEVTIGELRARVLGEYSKQPGGPAAEFSMAPYAYLHERFLEQTGLVQTGSRIRHELVFALPEGQSAEEWKAGAYDEARSDRLQIRTSDESAANVRRFSRRLSAFSSVVGLVSLFLGALGVASGMHAFMASKLDNAAVLRSLGATSRDVFVIYGLLVLRVALLGSLVGVAGGALVALLASEAAGSLARGLLPADLELSITPSAALHGVGAGLVSSATFALLPVWRMASVPPLRVLGRRADPPQALRAARLATPVALCAALIGVLAVSATESGSALVGAFFTLAIAFSLAALAGLARLIAWLARRLGPLLSSFHLRQGIANLHRPGNQTRAVIVAVGLGFTLIGTLAIVESSLSALIAVESRAELPNLFIVDVQPDQQASVERALERAGARDVSLDPMISARIQALNGASIDASDVERDAGEQSFRDRMRTREYFVGVRAETTDGEVVTEGRFWRGAPDRQEASIDERLAENLGASVGDTLTLDVQGIPVDATVTSFRRIDWLAMRPNSMILLSPGPIERAPGMIVVASRVPSAAARQALQSDLVERHPNLTIVDATEAAQTVRLIVSRVASVFQALGLVSVMLGAVIVAGAIAAGRFARQREAMLLKVLGASRRDLRRILVAEYATLALMGLFAGWLLAELTNRVAMSSLFQTSARVPYAFVAGMALAIALLNTLVGLSVSRRTSRARPLDVLREG